MLCWKAMGRVLLRNGVLTHLGSFNLLQTTVIIAMVPLFTASIASVVPSTSYISSCFRIFSSLCGCDRHRRVTVRSKQRQKYTVEPELHYTAHVQQICCQLFLSKFWARRRQHAYILIDGFWVHVDLVGANEYFGRGCSLIDQTILKLMNATSDVVKLRSQLWEYQCVPC